MVRVLTRKKDSRRCAAFRDQQGRAYGTLEIIASRRASDAFTTAIAETASIESLAAGLPSPLEKNAAGLQGK